MRNKGDIRKGHWFSLLENKIQYNILAEQSRRLLQVGMADRDAVERCHIGHLSRLSW